MGRLIDTSNIRVKPQYMQDVMGIAMIRCEDLARILADVSTAEAIPKADYENRLKADITAILEEIDLQFDEISFCKRGEWKTVPEIKAEYKAIIQEKINELKGVQDED